jgi:hypothetical protein
MMGMTTDSTGTLQTPIPPPAMKRLPAFLILLLLFGPAFVPAVFGQSLPASMAYSSSMLVHDTSVGTGQKLLITGNSLDLDQRSSLDLSAIPAAPDSVVRNPNLPSATAEADENTDDANNSTSKLSRSAALLGVLAIAYLATRKRPNPRMQADISELRNFPKKRLAHHGAHA